MVALAVSAVVVSVAACSSVSLGTGEPAAAVEKRGPAGPVPAGLGAFYGQSLTWGDCARYATTSDDRTAFGSDDLQCARMRVPLDYARPGGQTISLALMRVKATDQADRIGSLVTNPGGPGGSGLELVANLDRTWGNTGLAKRFDLVGFDPRGIGASQPAVRCLTGRQQDEVRASDLDDATTPSGIAAYERQQKQYAQACASNTGFGKQLLANVGTRDVAKDMDVLRSVLGDKKLSYLGYSYGTFVGSTYAEDFPGNVRAMVLDGAVDPTESEVQATVAQGTGFQAAFTKFAQWCASRPQCALSRNAANATQAFRALVNPLLDQPVPAGRGRNLTYDDATTGAIQALYSQQYWTYLNSGLNELKQGSGRTLMALADVYDGRNPDGTYSNEQDAFTAIRCVDDPPVTDPNVQKAAEQQYKKVAPFLDDGKPAIAQTDACAVWPVPPTSKPHQPSAKGLPRVLVVSTTNDPATPYQAGVNLAKALGGALLTFEGTQHTAFLQGISCVDKYGTNYLTSLTLPPSGSRCTR
ncbi:MAG TPA: alpha/beta hydrolase [Pseudonocardiaceae bacterium]|jgi:pimeloyl-ACP methyl ester carboxylesterase|nr:alpha/beta hydrolase [Pseudonocardiaceae bacterium]